MTADTYLSEQFGPEESIARSLGDVLGGMVYDSTFLLMSVSCILALILGQEFSFRTIHQEVSAVHSRFTIFMSKTVVYLIAFHFPALLYPITECIRELC